MFINVLWNWHEDQGLRLHQGGAFAPCNARPGCDTLAAAFASCNLAAMNAEQSPLEELRARLAEALRGSPARDLEKNLQALLAAFFDRFDLAAREDLEIHKKLLDRAHARLAALEARIAELESRKPGA
jgi:ubiquinone biosynthesis accessory factor UbiK